MNALFNRLNSKEKRTLERLTAAVLLAAALFFVLAVRQRSRYFEARAELDMRQENARRAEKSQAEAKADWLRWQEALRDLESFRGTYFYDEKTVFRSLRRDLQQIFGRAGMDIPMISYQYSDLGKVPMKKVLITFNYSGTYADLKRFLAIVERFPRFLAVEKVDFQKTDADSGLLHLRLTLAGYYAI
jgi:Tfp pilus assembly protein PilO